MSLLRMLLPGSGPEMNNLPNPFYKRGDVKKSGLQVRWEYLQSFTNAVVLKGEVIRLCNER